MENEFVKTSFFRAGPNKIELLQATDERSAIYGFIDRKGEGIHHIAFAVEDIEAETERLKGEGFKALFDQPKRGADNMLVMFFHLKTTVGVLIVLCLDADK